MALCVVVATTAACRDIVDPADPVSLSAAADAPAATVDPTFLSFAIDTSQVAGSEFWTPEGVNGPVDPFDFFQTGLRDKAAALMPGTLRVGGTDADRMFFDDTDGLAEPPGAYRHILTRAQVADMCAFARDLRSDIAFTLNAGPGPRDQDRVWQPDNARVLLEAFAALDCPVSTIELGNEVSAFSVVHGPDTTISEAQYAADLAVARALVDEVLPGVKLAGPASAYWPVSGEFGAWLPDALEAGGEHLDVVTWHYYPQQSDRCPIQVREAEPEIQLNKNFLAEVEVWAQEVEDAAGAFAPAAEVWLGETGHAQCGGQRGISDRAAATFWWVDELGRMARRGQQKVVRQTLVGSDYELLEEETLKPNPDFYASVLWQRLMGPVVLDVQTDDEEVLVYSHCHPGAGVSGVVLNLTEDAHDVVWPAAFGVARDVYRLETDDLFGPVWMLNGETLPRIERGPLPPLPPVAEASETEAGEPVVAVAATSIVFVHFADADLAACR